MKLKLIGLFTGLLMAVFGGVFILIGWWAMEQVRPFADGVTTSAQVVGAVEGSVVVNGIAHRDYAPVYVFETADGEVHQITDHATASFRPLPVGTTVEVSYREDDPSSVRRIDVDRGWLRWFVVGGTPVAAAGTVLALGSFVGLVVGARPRRRDDLPGPSQPRSSSTPHAKAHEGEQALLDSRTPVGDAHPWR